jgi:predicted RNA binding protein YcfA (HicA-like mRNA interferase family)
MPKLKKQSGRVIVKTLCNQFGFMVKRQKGSHVLLVKETKSGKIGCVVPLHREIKTGTLKAILEQAGISEEEYSRQG